MSQDVAQWLAEIKSLRQQLAEAQREREQAYASAANWQRLYETEAQQRRTETILARQTIEELQTAVQQLRGRLSSEVPEAQTLAAIEQEVAHLQTAEELKAYLVTVMADRDRLVRALDAEQSSHAQTRKSLTTALGDAIDLLSREPSAAEPRTAPPENP